MHRRRVLSLALICVAAVTAGVRSYAQLPLAPLPRSGSTVNPVFEGWYPNPDGTRSISFGYYNRNAEEPLDIPIGINNLIVPGEPNQGQPAHFEPRRHWGVFAVKVPADFGSKDVVWTLKIRGEVFAIPGNLQPNWQIDALEGEAGSGNTPPVVKFSATGPEGAGPYGVTAGPLRVFTISGRAIGITVSTNRVLPPPCNRRLAGSSDIDAARLGIFCEFTAWPACPRTPRNAPVPPKIALFPRVTAKGDPGGATPAPRPEAMMLPIGVPSALRISKVA